MKDERKKTEVNNVLTLQMETVYPSETFVCHDVTTPVVFNLFSPRTPRDTFPLNFVPPKLLVPNSSYT
jgi:hypothetical protein